MRVQSTHELDVASAELVPARGVTLEPLSAALELGHGHAKGRRLSVTVMALIGAKAAVMNAGTRAQVRGVAYGSQPVRAKLEIARLLGVALPMCTSLMRSIPFEWRTRSVGLADAYMKYDKRANRGS